MTADDDARDPSATLTPEGLAAALWLLDNYELPRRTARIMREVFAVARAAVDERDARQAHALAIMRALTNHDLRVARKNHEQAEDSLHAAIAALCALARDGAS